MHFENIMLSAISQNIKLKATNEHLRKTNKNSQTQTIAWRLPEGRWAGGSKG